MKNRFGFISNSSSSSFIVEYNNEQDKDKDIINFNNNPADFYRTIKIENKENILSLCKDYLNEEELNLIKNKILNSSNHIYFITIDWNDYLSGYTFDKLVHNQSFQILRSI